MKVRVRKMRKPRNLLVLDMIQRGSSGAAGTHGNREREVRKGWRRHPKYRKHAEDEEHMAPSGREHPLASSPESTLATLDHRRNLRSWETAMQHFPPKSTIVKVGGMLRLAVLVGNDPQHRFLENQRRTSVMMEHRMRATVELPERITVEQRERIAAHRFDLRLALLHVLRGVQYELRAYCQQCMRQLTPLEILRGFNADPTDFTTRCTGCGHRFAPTLMCWPNGEATELPFFCVSQTLAQLPGKETLTSEQFAREHAAIYRSAIVHHGGLRQAFAVIGIAYPHEETSDWRGKIAPFLGRMPDTVIAECVHVSADVIGRMRRRNGVPRYSLHAALAEAGVD